MISKAFARPFVLKGQTTCYSALELNHDMLLPTECWVVLATVSDHVCNAAEKARGEGRNVKGCAECGTETIPLASCVPDSVPSAFHAKYVHA